MEDDLRRQLLAMQTEIDNIARGISRLTKAIQEADELEDHIAERREHAEEEERDERHKKIMRLIAGMPEAIVHAINLKVKKDVTAKPCDSPDSSENEFPALTPKQQKTIVQWAKDRWKWSLVTVLAIDPIRHIVDFVRPLIHH